MFAVDVKQQNNITLIPDKIYQRTVKQTHSNVPGHDSSPKQPHSVSHPKAPPFDKNHFSSLFIFPRIKSLCKQGTADDLITDFESMSRKKPSFRINERSLVGFLIFNIQSIQRLHKHERNTQLYTLYTIRC